MVENTLNSGFTDVIGSHYGPGQGADPSMEDVMRITLSHTFYFNSVTAPAAVSPVNYRSGDQQAFNPTQSLFAEARIFFGRDTPLSAIVSLGSGDRRVGISGPSHEPNAELNLGWLLNARRWIDDPWIMGEQLKYLFNWKVYLRFSVHSPGFFNLDEEPANTDEIVGEVRRVTANYLAESLVVTRMAWLTQLLIHRPNLATLAYPQ